VRANYQSLPSDVMYSFKLEMHQNCLRSGLYPRLRWGSSRRFPIPPSRQSAGDSHPLDAFRFSISAFQCLATTSLFFILLLAPEDIQPSSRKTDAVRGSISSVKALSTAGMDWISVNSATVNSFKNGLRRTRQNKMGFFMD